MRSGGSSRRFTRICVRKKCSKGMVASKRRSELWNEFGGKSREGGTVGSGMQAICSSSDNS